MSRWNTAGFSDAASVVNKAFSQAYARKRNTETFGLDSDLRMELENLWGEVREENWDGYHAQPISNSVLRNVYLLLESLPADCPVPALSAEPDGHMVLEWYRSPTKLVSVSVGTNGELHYASLNSLARRANGTEFSDGTWPESILRLIKSVMQ